MKSFRILIEVVLLITMYSSFSQVYKPVVKSDTSVWYFAHLEMPGIYLDTLYAGQETVKGTEIWYKGQYFNHEEQLVGTARSSENYDKLWFRPSDDSVEYLIYDISLEKGDEFQIYRLPSPTIVDTVYQAYGRRIVEFDIETGWNESYKFIEGVGPNVTFVRWWRGPGINSPVIVCSFERDTKVFESPNPAFLDCSINYTNINPYDDDDVEIFPNPFKDNLTIRLNNFDLGKNLVISIHNITGQTLYSNKSDTGVNIHHLKTSFEPGVYILSLTSLNRQYTYKIIKQ